MTKTKPLLWSVGMTVVAAGGYLGLLGWDQHKRTDAVTGAETGPYEAWQVIALGALVAVVGFVAGRAGHAVLATVVVPLVLTTCFVVDAVGDSDGDGLWPIGAGLLAVGSAVGVGVVAAIGAHLRHKGGDVTVAA